MDQKLPKVRRIFTPISLIVLSFVFLALWIVYFLPLQEKNTKVSYLDVGQGDSAFISFPDGKNALIDGGSDKKVLEKVGSKMPFYKKKIDIVFLSHPHADHVTGLVYVLKNYEVGRVVITRAVHTAPEYQEFLKMIKENRVPTTEAIVGTTFGFSPEDSIKVLFPQSVAGVTNLNNTSEVLLLKSGENKFLFMGDLEKDAAEELMSKWPDLKADVIKVPHHGSQNALSEALYGKVSPKYAVISVGKDNKYGHPHVELIEFLQKAGIKYFRTDQEGDVEFESAESGVERIQKSGPLSF